MSCEVKELDEEEGEYQVQSLPTDRCPYFQDRIERLSGQLRDDVVRRTI